MKTQGRDFTKSGSLPNNATKVMITKQQKEKAHNNNNNKNNNNDIYLFNVKNMQQRPEPKKKKMLIKFDEKEYWCELLCVTNINYKP